MPALRVRPWALTTSLPRLAMVAGKARLMATPAPMVLPVAAPVVTAAPSAVALASVLPLAVSETMPPDVRVRPSGTVADWLTRAMLTPTAAATWSGVLLPEPSFWELEAEGVWVPEVSEPEPKLLPPSELAKSRWSPTSWLTVRLLPSPLVREASSWPGAPVAEAEARASLLELAVELMAMAPPALSERSTEASDLWMATVTAIAKPRALAAAVAAPLAWVSAEAV